MFPVGTETLPFWFAGVALLCLHCRSSACLRPGGGVLDAGGALAVGPWRVVSGQGHACPSVWSFASSCTFLTCCSTVGTAFYPEHFRGNPRLPPASQFWGLMFVPASEPPGLLSRAGACSSRSARLRAPLTGCALLCPPQRPWAATPRGSSGVRPMTHWLPFIWMCLVGRKGAGSADRSLGRK